jgi:hypothetical protein
MPTETNRKRLAQAHTTLTRTKKEHIKNISNTGEFHGPYRSRCRVARFDRFFHPLGCDVDRGILNPALGLGTTNRVARLEAGGRMAVG